MLLVYVEYINKKLIWGLSSAGSALRLSHMRPKDWSLEMYNEKTRQEGVLFRQPSMTMPHRQMRTPSRDLPDYDRQAPMQCRRRCDGSLVEPHMDMGADMDMRSHMGERQGNCRGEARMDICQGDCANGKCGGWGLEKHPLAMVYSPCQAFKGLYAIDVALSRGTLFSELDLPFEPKKCKRGGTL